jgi:hypothetical protein
MNHKFDKSIAAGILVSLSLALILATSLFTGCSDKLSGDIKDNQRPIAYFVNIPPGPQYDTLSLSPLVIDTVFTRFSRNPFLYWYGTDIDGQIDYFRYVVVTEPEMSLRTPEEMAAILETDSMAWNYLDVSATEADPHTTEIVKLRANSLDPVNTYLVQYVFLQAFDEQGLGSIIKYRGFSRNDSPPAVGIDFIDIDVPYINSLDEGVITGVAMSWEASDPDYPSGTDAPPFDYEWCLYGPYEDSYNGREVFRELGEKFVSTVYLTSRAEVYKVGDTIFCDRDEDPTCDDFVITLADVMINDLGDTRGTWRLFFEVDSLASDSFFNRIAAASDGWTNDSSVTVYNAYRNYNPPPGGDTTVKMNFVFWVNCRDDALVETPVPSVSMVKDKDSDDLNSFKVIDPKFERAVLVIDMNIVAANNGINLPYNPDTTKPLFYTQREYWKGVIDGWGSINVPGWNASSCDIVLDPAEKRSPDYLIARKAGLEIPITEMLKHKVVILYNDNIAHPKLSHYTNIWRAIDAGCNMWAVMRAPLDGGQSATDVVCQKDILGPTLTIHHNNYGFYFGVSEINYSGWQRHHFTADSGNPYEIPMRIEHFVRATSSADLGGWPTLTIDTARLHSMYYWDDSLHGLTWIPDTAALPEVNWVSYRPKYNDRGVSVMCRPMYIFGSRYGQNNHPAGGCLPDYDGSPVAHWLRSDYFKTVHFCFTPLAMDPVTFQVTANRVLNYLYFDNRMEP